MFAHFGDAIGRWVGGLDGLNAIMNLSQSECIAEQVLFARLCEEIGSYSKWIRKRMSRHCL